MGRSPLWCPRFPSAADRTRARTTVPRRQRQKLLPWPLASMDGFARAESSRPGSSPTQSRGCRRVLDNEHVLRVLGNRPVMRAPQRILMAPGPSNLHPRVVQALIEPLVGHKDPFFLDLMDETASALRDVFQTHNPATFALPATGGSGMEAALINVLEPGDTVVVGSAGFFARRMVDICMRVSGVNV